jgi:hypothetical protein
MENAIKVSSHKYFWKNYIKKAIPVTGSSLENREYDGGDP